MPSYSPNTKSSLLTTYISYKIADELIGLGSKDRSEPLTLEDLERLDVAFDQELTVFDSERVIVEEGVMVGSTGNIRNGQLILSQGQPPSRFGNLAQV